jgi:hypothetical protein
VLELGANDQYEFGSCPDCSGEKVVSIPGKFASTYEEAESIEEKYEGQPYGRIRWARQDPCLFLHCTCGTHSRIYGRFDSVVTYAFTCSDCGASYKMNPRVELIRIEESPSFAIRTWEEQWE